MKVQGMVNPGSFTVEEIPGTKRSLVRLYQNVEACKIAKDAEDKEGLDGFQYDEYCVEVESWPGLAASVRENYDTYLAKGKDNEVDRWSALAKAIGKAINADISKRLDEIEKKLDSHIKTDDQGRADDWRAAILRFNNELLRPIRHTKEEFVEVLGYIDKYEHYCEKNPEYPNSRAEIAIENIREVYKVRLKKRDFLQDEDKKEVAAL